MKGVPAQNFILKPPQVKNCLNPNQLLGIKHDSSWHFSHVITSSLLSKHKIMPFQLPLTVFVFHTFLHLLFLVMTGLRWNGFFGAHLFFMYHCIVVKLLKIVFPFFQTQAPKTDGPRQKRKFSTYFKSLVIELDRELYGPDNHLVEVSSALNNGNGTEWSSIWFVIIQVINKLCSRPIFFNHKYDYRPNWMTWSSVTN